METARLTRQERETLEAGAALIGWADSETAHAELVEAVERIIGPRMAEAWDEGYRVGIGDALTDALTALGNPYDQ